MNEHGDHDLDHLKLKNQERPEVPWHLEIIGVPEAWNAGYKSSPSIGVAILDSGIDVREGFARRHLGDNTRRWPRGRGRRLRGVVRGRDFVRKGGGRYRFLDRFGHGTKMAGIVGALPRASLTTRAGNLETYLYDGTLGVAPNCRMLNLRVADDEGRVVPSRVLRACELIHEKNSREGSGIWHTDVALLALEDEIWSLREPEVQERSDALRTGLDILDKAGVVVVLSAGDDLPTGKSLGEDSPWVGFPNTLMVTATEKLRAGETPRLLPTANYGPAVSISAPGEDVMTTSPMAPTPAFGTSAAAAIVAGAAALVCDKVNHGKQRKPAKVVEILLQATTVYPAELQIPPFIDLRKLIS
jgi:membrane-anchored mycosin MYCP